MPPKKNTVKMDLNAFLADDTFGSATDSWADDFDPSMLAPSSTVDLGIKLASKEPEIPERPPFTARIAGFPDGTDPFLVKEFFINGLKISNPDSAIEDFYCPKDADGHYKYFAFITFSTRDLLVDALTLNQQQLEGRPVTVGVAHPAKNERVSRGSRNFESNFDWGSARGSAQQRDFDYGSFRGPPRERKEAASFDWGAGRGTAVQREFDASEFRDRAPRERREPATSFDWGARGTAVQREFDASEFRDRAPRERREPAQAFDWGAARGSAVQKEFKPREFSDRAPREKKAAPAQTFEWGARGSMLKKQTEKPALASKTTEEKKAPIEGVKKSIYSVLATEEDDEEEESEEEPKKETKEDKDVAEVTASASKLDIEGDEWTTVN